MKTLNLTQHNATNEQTQAGVFDAPAPEQERIRALLTFNEPPTPEEMCKRAAALTDIARRLTADLPTPARVMIGGAPYFMPVLGDVLVLAGLDPVYAFSRREVVEQTAEDDSVRKTAIFKHVGFVPHLAGTCF